MLFRSYPCADPAPGPAHTPVFRSNRATLGRTAAPRNGEDGTVPDLKNAAGERRPSSSGRIDPLGIPRRGESGMSAPETFLRERSEVPGPLLHLFENTTGHRSGHVTPFAEGHAPRVETTLDLQDR